MKSNPLNPRSAQGPGDVEGEGRAALRVRPAQGPRDVEGKGRATLFEGAPTFPGTGLGAAGLAVGDGPRNVSGKGGGRGNGKGNHQASEVKEAIHAPVIGRFIIIFTIIAINTMDISLIYPQN